EAAGNPAAGALWRAAAVEMLERISIPLSHEMEQYATSVGEPEWAAGQRQWFEVEVRQPLARHRAALQRDRALAARQPPVDLSGEREKVEALTLHWFLEYPERFFRFGFYRQIKEEEKQLVQAGRAE